MQLFGSYHIHLAQIEKRIGGSIHALGNHVTITGSAGVVSSICNVLDNLYERLQRGLVVDIAEVDAAIRMGNE